MKEINIKIDGNKKVEDLIEILIRKVLGHIFEGKHGIKHYEIEVK